MLRKILMAAASVLLIGGPVFAGNADSESRNVSSNFGEGAYRDIYVRRVSTSGHIVNETGVGELGSPTYPWYRLHTATGLARHHETFLDLPAKDQDVVMAGTSLSTTTLAASGTTYITSDITQPSVPRNIVILATGAVAVGQSTITITGTNHCYVEGINAVGVSTNEYVTLVSTTDAAAGRGNVAWAFISSVTITGVGFTGTPMPNVKIFIGTSDKIGLVNDIAGTSDIYHVDEAGTVTTSYTANATYNTITFATAGDGTNDYNVRYIQKFFTPLP